MLSLALVDHACLPSGMETRVVLYLLHRSIMLYSTAHKYINKASSQSRDLSIHAKTPAGGRPEDPLASIDRRDRCQTAKICQFCLSIYFISSGRCFIDWVMWQLTILIFEPICPVVSGDPRGLPSPFRHLWSPALCWPSSAYNLRSISTKFRCPTAGFLPILSGVTFSPSYLHNHVESPHAEKYRDA